MKKILSLALAAAFCAPAFAQKMGSSNSNAPMVNQSVEASGAKMSLNYTAITWADGKTMSRLMDKEGGANARKRISDNAANSPLGTFNSSVDVMLGEQHVPAGEYAVFFTIGDDMAWSINLKGKDKTFTHKLALADAGHESKRLMLCMYATDNGAGVYVAFGKQSGDIQLPAHKAK
jgi:hypothetical protein